MVRALVYAVTLHVHWSEGGPGGERFAEGLRGFFGARIGGEWRLEVSAGGRRAALQMRVGGQWYPGLSREVTHLEGRGGALPLLTVFGDAEVPEAATLHNLVGLAMASGAWELAALEGEWPVVWAAEGPGLRLVERGHAGCLQPGPGRGVLYARGVPEAEPPEVALREVPGEVLEAETGVAGAVSRIAEGEIAVRAGLGEAERAMVLAHARLHLWMGHGWGWTHVDTHSSICAPVRRRDRLVYELDPDLFRAERPKDLEGCSVRERTALGLWEMAGELLGGTRPLHARARAYQQAAYQRQAAERLVAQLDTSGGAMLCDGVGLGKTYVATTVIVHCVNQWREERGDDPFRVTVIAPGSVVSTWVREALAPLAGHGVPGAWVRVVSHGALSRISRSSAILEPGEGGVCDLEHLVLSDLVIVDEAHNFRSGSAARTLLLRDLLALQHRKDTGRRVCLLTATPINNGLQDLEQELSLLFAERAPLSEAVRPEAFRRQSVTEVRERVRRAREAGGSVAALLAHGQAKASFLAGARLRTGLPLGEGLFDLGKYLHAEEKRLAAYRAQIQGGGQAEPVRIAEALLDRLVVQRSRALCRRIEQQEGSGAALMFRLDAEPPERLRYQDRYNETTDVLARFLSLFPGRRGAEGLSFKIYMWSDVRQGSREPEEAAQAVALQQILALKRLESSPVSFLITLLRLVVTHAVRLRELEDLCAEAGLAGRALALREELRGLLAGLTVERGGEDLHLLRWLCVGDVAHNPEEGFFEALRRGAPGLEEEPEQRQLLMFDAPRPAEGAEDRVNAADRLWRLKGVVLEDLRLLLGAAPELARIVFGAFDREAWPARFVAATEARAWPQSGAWGRRVYTDEKLAALIARVVRAWQAGQKVVVFSQFKDTLAYIGSVLRALTGLEEIDLEVTRARFGVDVRELLGRLEVVSGDTEDREGVIDRFAPFYRIGPSPPEPVDGQAALGAVRWEAAWTAAIRAPVDVLLATDVLAEGVNLQDAAVLINYDIHWNPVRMIQRSGRIDRRLNPAIERGAEAEAPFPALAALAARLGAAAPVYAWRGRSGERPVTVNLILPDELEAELKLRERIATKTLTIDATLGLERGTGAEADWMDAYTYQGVAALSVYDRDRAIEELAGQQKELERWMRQRGVEPGWAAGLGGWFREEGAGEEGVLLARAKIGRLGRELVPFARRLEPRVVDGVSHWLVRAADATFQRWLRLDGEERAADGVPVAGSGALAAGPETSAPLLPGHVSPVIRRLLDGEFSLAEVPLDLRVWQGIAAIADGRYLSEQDRAELDSENVCLLQIARC